MLSENLLIPTEEDNMKTLFVLLTSLLAVTAQAQTVFEHFTAYDQWVPIELPDGTLLPNIIVPGDFYCTGGGEPILPVGCEGGNGIHIRDSQGVSCVYEPATGDPRLEGMAWWNLSANWDTENTGPVNGIWRIVPGGCIEDASTLPSTWAIDLAIVMDPEGYWDSVDTYWEGTYTGKREVVPDLDAPLKIKWVSTLKYVGQGMGDLAGQKMKAVETITTYYPSPLPGEFFGITEPEGVVEITIKTKY